MVRSTYNGIEFCPPLVRFFLAVSMFKKLLVCAVGLASGVAVASFSLDALSGIFPKGSSEEVVQEESADPSAILAADEPEPVVRQLDLYGSSLQLSDDPKPELAESIDLAESTVIAAAEPSTKVVVSDDNEKLSVSEKLPIVTTKVVPPQKKTTTSRNIIKNETVKTPSKSKTAKSNVTSSGNLASTKSNSVVKKKKLVPKKSVVKQTTPTKEVKSQSVKTESAKLPGKPNRVAKTKSMKVDPVLERYSKESFTGENGKALSYRLLQPKYFDSKKKYPLVVLLHGAGERGDDNESQLVHGAKGFASEENSRKNPCFVLVPQCPKDQQWVDADWTKLSHVTTDEPTESMTLVIGAIDQLVRQQPIDSNRIYVTGLSMGGFGTFDLISRRPNMFAAGAPLCGGGDVSPEITKRLSRVPLWVVHGDQDQAVNVERSRQMVEAIRDAGGEPKYDEVAGAGHDVWTDTFANPDFFDWMFAQNLKPRVESVKKTSGNSASNVVASKAEPKPKAPRVEAPNPKTPKVDVAKTNEAAKAEVAKAEVRKDDNPKIATKSIVEKPKTPIAPKPEVVEKSKAPNTPKSEVAVIPKTGVKQDKKLKETSGRVISDATNAIGTEAVAKIGEDIEPGSLAAHFVEDTKAENEKSKKESKGSEKTVSDLAVKKTKPEPAESGPSESVPVVDLNELKIEDLQGNWSAVVARYKGKALSEAQLGKMNFEFKDDLLTISQNGKRQNGMIELGLVVKAGVVNARMIDFVAPKKNSPSIKGLCYFEEDKFVILLHPPGSPRPATFENVDRGRLLVLQRNTD